MNEVTHILVVEDEEAHAELIRRALAGFGERLRLTFAGSLAEARSSLACDTPDLVITDLLLPDGEGIELLPRDGNPPFALVLMTSFGDEHVAVEAIKAGALDYLVKSPTTFSDMPRTIARALREWRHILERRRAEDALRESERRYRAIFDQTFQFAGLITLDGRIIEANRSALELIGAQPAEVLGKPFAETPWWAHSPALQDRVRDAIAAASRGEFVRFETTHRAVDGTLHAVDFSIKPVRDETGKVLLLIPEGRDITDRKLAEEEAAALEVQLRQAQKLEAIGRLAGGIAHDFNNMLTAIIGFADLLQTDMHLDDPRKPYADQILVGASKAANLTRGLLAFSRTQVIEPAAHDINSLIRDMEKLLRCLVTDDITFRIQCTDTELFATVDVTQIDQVLLNLVTNARDAMPHGGDLTISTCALTMNTEFIRSHGFGQLGAYAQLSVVDSGVGMDAATQQRIFDPFFTTKAAGHGTGLGLSTVYGIVSQHKGYIEVDSKPSSGTTFHIYLPTIPRANQEPQAKLTDIRGGSETILVAEDDAVSLNLLQIVLAGHGYRVIAAIDGQEAVEKFRQSPCEIALLILDVVMPRKNGMEAYQDILRINTNCPPVKVLFTSGYTGDIVIAKGVADKAADFIPKPLSPRILLARVREILDR